MVNYANGKIYKIVCNITGKIYIGSTTLSLSQRLVQHRTDYNGWKNGKRKFVTSFGIIENGNYDIVLLEEFPCENKEQLYQRERFYIESLICVNKVIPTRTNKEYRIDNADKIKEYYIDNIDKIKDHQKNYYIDNADKIKEQSKLYRLENTDKIREQNKIYHIENIDKIKEQKKIYRLENADKIRERKKIYYIDNANKFKEYKKIYHQENKEKIKEKDHQKYLKRKEKKAKQQEEI